MFTGVLTALVTPMRDGEVDLEALRELARWQIDCGVDGLVPCGTTGEAATLEPGERVEVIRTVVEVAAGKVPVIAGAGTNATRSTVVMAQAARAAGADGVLLVCPYYNKPTQAGLEAHFQAVLAEVDCPVVLYNIPGRAAVDMAVDTVLRLSTHPKVVGIKEATGSVVRAADLVRQLDGRAAVLAGDDPLYLPILAVGGAGIVSATASVAPEQMVAVMRHFRQGELGAAREAYFELLDLVSALFAETSPAPAKAALHMMGRIAPELRLPLVWSSPATEERVRGELVRLGLVAP